MSLVKSVFVTTALLAGGVVSCTSQDNPFYTLMTSAGRAIERRYDTNFKVTRHSEFRTALKLASGKRLRLPHLAA